MTGNEAKYAAAANFAVDGEIRSVERYGDGHINATYLVTTDTGRYIMQRMNTEVFPDTANLMRNIELVTEFLRSRGQETLEIIRTKDGATYVETADGAYRMYAFIEDTISYLIYHLDISDNPNITFDASAICYYWQQGVYNLIYDKTQNILNCDKMLE